MDWGQVKLQKKLLKKFAPLKSTEKKFKAEFWTMLVGRRGNRIDYRGRNKYDAGKT